MKCGLLVVSVGTTLREAEETGILPVERALAAAFPARRCYRAWTGTAILRRLREVRGNCPDDVTTALERMAEDDIRDVLIQPTCLVAGAEFAAMRQAVEVMEGRFSSVKIGMPLLADEEDLARMAEILRTTCAPAPGEAVLLMAHGSAVAALPTEFLREPLYLGFRTGKPDCGDLIGMLRQRPEIRKVRLLPMMMTAGYHACRDLAGDGPDSWKSQLQRAGYRTECLLRGLGELPEIRQLLIDHARMAERETE